MTELTGTIKLDEETLETLREEIRREVIEDIRVNGNYSSEIEKYLKDCKYTSYMHMIKSTIDHIIVKTNVEEDVKWDSDAKLWKQLNIIKGILNL